MHRSSFFYKWKQSRKDIRNNVSGFWSVRKHYYGLWTFTLALMMDLFITNMQIFASQDVNWWTGVVWITCKLLWCFYQLLGLSSWRHPFTAEDPLLSKWYNAKFLPICEDEETNSSTFNGLRVYKCSEHFVNYSLILQPHSNMLKNTQNNVKMEKRASATTQNTIAPCQRVLQPTFSS